MECCSRSKTGASCFFDDLNKTAQNALVFWSPEDCASVVPILAVEAGSGEKSHRFDLTQLECRKVALITPDGAVHLLLTDSGRAIQLMWKGADMLSDHVMLTAPIALFSGSDRERLTMRRLWDLQQRGSISDRLFAPHANSGRLKMALQALDGRLTGASWRRVAAALFGEPTAAEAWAGSSRFLLDKTRRLYWRGEAYMEGWYREFLR